MSELTKRVQEMVPWFMMFVDNVVFGIWVFGNGMGIIEMGVVE